MYFPIDIHTVCIYNHNWLVALVKISFIRVCEFVSVRICFLAWNCLGRWEQQDKPASRPTPREHSNWGRKSTERASGCADGVRCIAVERLQTLVCKEYLSIQRSQWLGSRNFTHSPVGYCVCVCVCVWREREREREKEVHISIIWKLLLYPSSYTTDIIWYTVVSIKV